MADLTEHCQAAEKALGRVMRPADARHFAAEIVAAQSSKLIALHNAQRSLGQLAEALGRVIADLDEGDEVTAGDLLAEIRRVGPGVHDAVVEAAAQVSELRLAEVEAVAL